MSTWGDEYDLPRLPEDWEWQAQDGDTFAACLFTWEYDCIVKLSGGSVHISTGVAPIEVIEAVVRVNTRKAHEGTSNRSPEA
jgi:hypothetical protein